jgi:hypothetical protein
MVILFSSVFLSASVVKTFVLIIGPNKKSLFGISPKGAKYKQNLIVLFVVAIAFRPGQKIQSVLSIQTRCRADPADW